MVGGAPELTPGRLCVVATKTFGITVLLATGLHVMPPIAFLVPLGTGFATGWNIRATIRQASLIGAIMGLWLAAILAGVLLVIGLVAPPLLVNIQGGGAIVGLLVGAFVVLHLAVFGGVGAAVGGHRARNEAARDAIAGS